MKYILLSIMFLTLFMWGCETTSSSSNSVQNMSELEVADDFSFSTTREVDLEISVFTGTNEPVNDIHFAIYKGSSFMEDDLITQGVTIEGIFQQTLSLPSMLDSLSLVGYMSHMTLPITSNEVSYRFGGAVARSKTSEIISQEKPTGDNRAFTYLSTYSSNGVPTDLEPESDYVSAQFLSRINSSLPEYQPVPQYHPTYLEAGSTLNIEIDELADVWITFLHEGAGYKNSLGFYTYNEVEGPPETADELEHVIIFPNASMKNSGGGLYSGDQIYIGQFPAGTVIGWFLVANGWNGSGVSENRTRYYSNPQYNPESDPLYRQHTVLLFDDDEEKLLLSFEDLLRPGGDNDFNDAVFTVTSNPVEAVDTSNVNPIDEDDDADDDGISDVYDDYPNDPDRAFDAHYPSAVTNGTLAFEDRWPMEGDYDLNDLVVEYHFHNIHNPQNKLLELNGEIKVMAIGAAYHNGFSFELPFSAADIASWSGDETVALEDNGSNAVIHVFDDAFDIIPQPATGFVNTEPDEPYYQPVSINFQIILTTAISVTSSSKLPPYNPFLLVNSDRAKEVHLADYTPTNMANSDYFQTGDDTTNPSSGRYYKTIDNLPWAIHLPQNWNHPQERSEIIWGYTKFGTWAESSGNNDQYWYKFEAGNINQDHIYVND